MINISVITFVSLVVVSVANAAGYRETHGSCGYAQFLSKDWTNNVRGLAILMIILAHIVTENASASIFGGGG